MSDAKSFPNLLVLMFRLALGVLLFYTGFQKLNTPAQFAEIIANFRLLPAQGNQLLAVILPWCEISAGLLLVLGLWTRAAGIVATAMFLAFGVAVTSALIRGLDIECGCFGTASQARVGLTTLAIDASGLIAATIVVWKSSQSQVVQVATHAG
jgi:uncharacterized membrane protein YphA (DoxX/SURF4 family)